MEVLSASRVIDSFTPEFVGWFQASYGDAQDALEALGGIKVFLTAAYFTDGTCSAIRITAASVAQFLDDLELVEAEVDGGEVLQVVVVALHMYIDFLRETDRWTGSLPEFERVHSLLIEEIGAEPAPFHFEIPELSVAEQAKEFVEISLIKRSTALLEWIGAGKEVTSNGVLRLKDIAQAAEIVGISVRPISTGKRRSHADPLPGLEESAAVHSVGTDGSLTGAIRTDQQPNGILTVRSMGEVPVLVDIWAAMYVNGLITVSPTRVTAGPAAARWLSGT